MSAYLVPLAWTLSMAVSIIGVVAWIQFFHGRVGHVSSYQLFPLFGLLAFSLMWSHYIVAALRVYLGVERERLHIYFEATSWAVLVALLLHPGLLVWQLWRDGFGLPPESYLRHFVAPELAWVALLGTMSLFIFLAFELRRWFEQRSWWWSVSLAGDIAMLAIFYHGLRLGSQLQTGWLRTLWFGYGMSYLIALVYLYIRRFRARTSVAGVL